MINKFKITNLKKGFTLLELLISITIIGILATIILQDFSNSRAKAYDSKVRQQLTSFRTAAEIYFNNQDPNNYGPAAAACGSGMFNDPNPVNGSPALYIAEGNLPVDTQVACQSTDSTYAVKASLYSGNAYWCVDNKGASRMIAGPITGPSLFCP